MYVIIHKSLANGIKTIYVKIPENKEVGLSVLDKSINRRYHPDNIIGTADDISFKLSNRKLKTYVFNFEDYVLPSALIYEGFHRDVSSLRRGERKVSYKDKSIIITPVLTALTEDELRYTLDRWQEYKEQKKRTPKQKEANEAQRQQTKAPNSPLRTLASNLH